MTSAGGAIACRLGKGEVGKYSEVLSALVKKAYLGVGQGHDE